MLKRVIDIGTPIIFELMRDHPQWEGPLEWAGLLAAGVFIGFLCWREKTRAQPTIRVSHGRSGIKVEVRTMPVVAPHRRGGATTPTGLRVKRS